MEEKTKRVYTLSEWLDTYKRADTTESLLASEARLQLKAVLGNYKDRDVLYIDPLHVTVGTVIGIRAGEDGSPVLVMEDGNEESTVSLTRQELLWLTEQVIEEYGCEDDSLTSEEEEMRRIQADFAAQD